MNITSYPTSSYTPTPINVGASAASQNTVANTINNNSTTVNISTKANDLFSYESDRNLVYIPEREISIKGNADSSTESGMDLVLHRLYNETSWDKVQPTQYGSSSNYIDQTYNKMAFLTKSDHKALAEIYEYARSNGVSLMFVDGLARDIGDYRAFSYAMTNYNNGMSIDNTGALLTREYASFEARMVDQIKNGNGLASTKLDRGYLDYISDPGYGSWYVDLGFLEQVINRTNPDGSSRGFDDIYKGEYFVGGTEFIWYKDGEVWDPSSDSVPPESHINNTDNLSSAQAEAQKNQLNYTGDRKALINSLLAKENKTDEEKRLLANLMKWDSVGDLIKSASDTMDKQQRLAKEEREAHVNTDKNKLFGQQRDKTISTEDMQQRSTERLQDTIKNMMELQKTAT